MNKFNLVAFPKECDKKMFVPNERSRIMNNSSNALLNINELKSYRYPVYRKTKNCDFVEFYAFNPETGKLGRKRIKINCIHGAKQRKQYANDLIIRINDKLSRGWNPFIVSQTSADLKIFSDCLDDFDKYNERMLADGAFREQTYVGYKSYNKILRSFSEQKEHKIYYLYQMDSHYLNDFLDDLYLNKGICARTRNNYITFLRVFCNFLKSRGHLVVDPTDGLQKTSKRQLKKEREIIPLDDIAKIAEYCKAKDPYFLLACYLLFYCFIRPQELCRLRVENIKYDQHTILIKASQSKNRLEQSITLNKKILDYIDELGLMALPSDTFIFSAGLKPGTKEMNPVLFRHHWDPLRDELGFSDSYKFYSLKDTGITELADSNVTNISIRDQARHSSLAITDIYTRHSSSKAIKELESYDGSL